MVPAVFQFGFNPVICQTMVFMLVPELSFLRFCHQVAEMHKDFIQVGGRPFPFGQAMSFQYTESYFNQPIEVAGAVKQLSFGADYFIPEYYKTRTYR